MIKRILERYYLVLMRGYDDWYVPTSVAAVISVSLTVNLLSIFILFWDALLFRYTFWVAAVVFIIDSSLMSIIDRKYTWKYSEKMLKRHEDESEESRRRGVVWVVVYEILTVAFFVLSCFTVERPQVT